jgi:hypothetical protein
MNTDLEQTRYLRMELEVDATTHATIEQFVKTVTPAGQEPVSVAHVAEMVVEEFALTLRLAGLHKKFDQMGCRHD